MKYLLEKVAVCGLILSTSVNVYGHKEDLLDFDSSAPLAPVIAKSVEDALRDIREAEEAAEQGLPKNLPYLFDRLPREKAVKQEETPAQKYLESDNTSLKYAKSILDFASKQTQKCRGKLKTQAAKRAVYAVLDAARIDLTDIEDAFIHNRFQESHSRATKILFAYITPSVLAGSKDERDDMRRICEYFFTVTYPLVEGMIEKGTFYSALRRHSAECHDIVPRNDFVARAAILQVVNFFGDLAMQNADDEDSCVTSVSALEASKDFAKGLELSFVDKLQATPGRFIFTNQATFARFSSFCTQAPDLFRYCESNTQATIEAKLWKDGWSYWEQKGYQTIWVNYEGDTSLRIKDDREFTVSFLSESPYFRDGSLDRTYLGARSSELIKYAPVRDTSFFIPASLDDTITGFWAAYTKYLQVSDGKKIMDFGHGMVK
jgi:hypothetical protein